MQQTVQPLLGAVNERGHAVDGQQCKADAGLVHAEIAEAHGGSPHQGAVQDTSKPVVGTGVGFVEQEHRTEQHRTGVQLVPDALQAGQQAAEEGAVRQTHLTREEEGDEPAGDQKTC